MKKFLAGLVAGLFVLAGSPAGADDEHAELRAKLEQRLSELGVDAPVQRIQRSPVDDLYLVMLGGQVVYVSGDARYILQGDMFDTQTRQMVSDQMHSGSRKQQLEEHGVENMIVYPASTDETAHVVTVFTDIECPFCQRMHARMDEYNALGIEVRYVQFPRAGVGSSAYQKAVSVWCADDRRDAMNRIKAGERLPEGDCENPVADQFALSRELGVNATPTIITEGGRMHRGLVEPQPLKEMLDEEKSGG
ncbi:MAG: DsbC family protein [Ectothiorhodospiraceae bacterium]|nr:DsbC family protein [Ectothiorhodospiraceae bacterium]